MCHEYQTSHFVSTVCIFLHKNKNVLYCQIPVHIACRHDIVLRVLGDNYSTITYLQMNLIKNSETRLIMNTSLITQFHSRKRNRFY
jgi:hypothetical protein